MRCAARSWKVVARSLACSAQSNHQPISHQWSCGADGGGMMSRAREEQRRAGCGGDARSSQHQRAATPPVGGRPVTPASPQSTVHHVLRKGRARITTTMAGREEPQPARRHHPAPPRAGRPPQSWLVHGACIMVAGDRAPRFFFLVLVPPQPPAAVC